MSRETGKTMDSTGIRQHRAQLRVMRILVSLALLIATSVQIAPLRPAAAQKGDPVTAALLRLYLIHRDGDHWRSILQVSAFFVDEQGKALTDGVVARPIREQPDMYRLIAVREGVLFGAMLVCAPTVARKPGPLMDAEFEKEIAVVKLMELDLPGFDVWRYGASGDRPPVIIAQKHRGRLPTFQPLVIGDDPREGDRVRIAAYGRLLETRPVPPERWSASGQVTRVFKSATGLPIFAADIGSAHVDYISGSVIVQADGRAAGLSVWDRSGPPAEVLAISASALREPCR